MHRDNQRFRTHMRLIIGIVCSLLIIGSSTILLILHTTSIQKSSMPPSTAATTHATATSIPTPTPMSTGTQGITPIPTPLFSDNFSNNSQGWYMSNTGGYTRSLTADGLTLTDTNHTPMIESLPTNHKFDDFTLTTTLTLKKGDVHDSTGVYLRGDSNLDHDYRIDIFGNSMYAISKEYLDTANIPQTLYIIAPTHDSSLRPKGEANTLTVIMKGPTMILLVNSKLANAIIDEDYTRGQIALFAASSATSSGITAVFSAIEIDSAPDQFPLTESCPSPTTGTPEPTPTPCSGTCVTPVTNSTGATPTSCK